MLVKRVFTLMKADARRQMAIDIFEQSHIAPSHRRLPHLSWTTSFSLLLVRTVAFVTPSLMSVMYHTSAITLVALAQTPFHDGKTLE